MRNGKQINNSIGRWYRISGRSEYKKLTLQKKKQQRQEILLDALSKQIKAKDLSKRIWNQLKGKPQLDVLVTIAKTPFPQTSDWLSVPLIRSVPKSRSAVDMTIGGVSTTWNAFDETMCPKLDWRWSEIPICFTRLFAVTQTHSKETVKSST